MTLSGECCLCGGGGISLTTLGWEADAMPTQPPTGFCYFQPETADLTFSGTVIVNLRRRPGVFDGPPLIKEKCTPPTHGL